MLQLYNVNREVSVNVSRLTTSRPANHIPAQKTRLVSLQNNQPFFNIKHITPESKSTQFSESVHKA